MSSQKRQRSVRYPTEAAAHWDGSGSDNLPSQTEKGRDTEYTRRGLHQGPAWQKVFLLLAGIILKTINFSSDI